MSIIETIDLRKEYGDTVAVDSLNLTVYQGEVFGFLGANGAGKTTTIKMLLGLIHPTAGQTRIIDHAPGAPAAMAKVGFLPEHFRFSPWLTAEGFLDIHARLYGMPADLRRRRIPELLERVRLADRAHNRLNDFSKGMLQRIGLAQALLNSPSLVFLDEPTSGLDPLGRRDVRNLIQDLRKAGVTVFLNSHLLSEVEAVCDRIAIIERGRVLYIGTLDELTQGSITVEIRAAGLTPGLLAGLEQWGRVTQGDDTHVQLAVESDEAIPLIADWLVQGNARLYTLASRCPSLEDLFVRIVEEEQ